MQLPRHSMIKMKYQKLENQEANWKWIYLIRKHQEVENITRYEERSLQKQHINY